MCFAYLVTTATVVLRTLVVMANISCPLCKHCVTRCLAMLLTLCGMEGYIPWSNLALLFFFLAFIFFVRVGELSLAQRSEKID